MKMSALYYIRTENAKQMAEVIAEGMMSVDPIPTAKAKSHTTDYTHRQ